MVWPRRACHCASMTSVNAWTPNCFRQLATKARTQLAVNLGELRLAALTNCWPQVSTMGCAHQAGRVPGGAAAGASPSWERASW